MAKPKTIYVCRDCGYETVKWLGRCPSCQGFNTFEQSVEEPETPAASHLAPGAFSKPMRLADIQPITGDRISTGLTELDTVLSGGVVQGSLTLIGGDPGIGKSTLLLQICQHFSDIGKHILYVSGEESAQQIKLRADRLGVSAENLLLAAETSMKAIEGMLFTIKPDFAVIDSIQTIYNEDITSTPGSVAQVRACTQALMRLAKTRDISIFIIGHVTKEGAIAGPRVLEHMVDTVLYFEGERRESYRIIHAVKNRFGATDEIGVFEMSERGLLPITNPSAYMLSGRPLNMPGSVITCGLEGTRPILLEIQALLSYTSFGTPRRMATGLDYNRVTMLLAVLEKRAGFQIGNYDSYMNITGGVRLSEPALDAAVVTAAASSYKNKAADPYTVVFGEIGLTGELRAVNQAEKRVNEAYKLGFKQCVIPQANLNGLARPEKCRVMGAANVNELLEVCIG